MNLRLTHTTLFVLDQDVALDFYVNKLGFTVSMDHSTPSGFRWLTVTPPKQPDWNVTLLKVEAGDGMNERTATLLRELLSEGIMPAVGAIQCDDCRAVFADLSAKGVKFQRDPADQFYGVDATIEDPFGNTFTLLEPMKR